LPESKPNSNGDSTQSRRQVRGDFFAQMGTQQFHLLFEPLPGIYFFAKDRESRLMCASQPILERLGVPDEDSIVGTRDHEYFPPQLADNFVQEDQQVIKTGKPLINRVEI